LYVQNGSVQSAQDINWDVVTEHKVTWATYKAV